jgi:pimeloyl-ACP methyl ester carboxylesterase
MRPFALALLAFLAIGAPARAYTVESAIAVTQDRVVLALKRYKNPGGEPVLMIHGFGSNMYEFDLPSMSLADALARAGFDVWLANWRRTGKRPFRSSGRAGYTFDDVVHFDVPALVETVRAATGRRPFLLGHSMGAMVIYAYLEGAHYERTLVARTPRLTFFGIAWDEVFEDRIAADPALSAARNAGIRGFVAIAGPPRFRWKIDARPWDFWRYDYWDYNIILTELAWSPAANLAARSVPEVPAGELTNFLTDDLVFLPFVGPEVRPFLAYVAAQVAKSYLSAEVMVPSNMDAQVAFEALDWAADDSSTGIYRQFLDGIRGKTMREAHVLDPLHAPYVYADRLGAVTAPALVIGGRRDKICNDDVLFQDGFLELGSPDKTYLSVDAGHLDIVMGKNAPRDVWAPIEAWLKSH